MCVAVDCSLGLKAMTAISMSEKGKAMSEAGGEFAGRIAAERGT